LTFSAFLTIVVIIIVVIAGGFLLFRPGKRVGPESLYAEALAKIIAGKNSDAIKLLKTVVKTDTNHINAYLHLGNLLRESNTIQAIKIHQSLIVRPKLSKHLQIDIYKALAQDYFYNKDFKRAIREAEQVLTLEKRSLWAIEFMLKIAELETDWDGAMGLSKQIQKIKGIKDQNILAEYMGNKSDELGKNGDSKGAESGFRKAIKMAPDYPWSYYNLGQLYEENGNLSKAVGYWEAFAERAGSDSVKVYNKIESSLYELGRFGEVEQFYTKMIKIDSTDLDALIKLANVVDAKGEVKQALGLVEEAIEQNDDSLAPELMKIKLLLNSSPPGELAVQVDKLIEKISEKS